MTITHVTTPTRREASGTLVALIILTFAAVASLLMLTYARHEVASRSAPPPNPVAFLRKSGCIIPPGTVAGRPAPTAITARFAGCSWGAEADFGESLTVWTYSSDADRDLDLQNVPQRDGQVVIMGPRFIAELTGACCADVKYTASAATVAARLGGVIVR